MSEGLCASRANPDFDAASTVPDVPGCMMLHRTRCNGPDLRSGGRADRGGANRVVRIVSAFWEGK